MTTAQPLIQEIAFQSPLALFVRFATTTGAMLLDSADATLQPSALNRYSYIALAPFGYLTSKNGLLHYNGTLISCDPWVFLHTTLAQYKLLTDHCLPPFQGGMVGYFAYDLGLDLEHISSTAQDDFAFPDLAIGLYDLVISFDHLQQRAWIIASGLPAQTLNAQRHRAQQRLNWLLDQLKMPYPLPEIDRRTIGLTDITANFSSARYQQAVGKVIAYIRAGDIFQANLAQRFTAPLPCSPFGLYRRLRLLNPAPFAAYLNCGDTIIASASPERFLHCEQGCVTTHPIKGTRPRGMTLAADAALKTELLHSAKDQAENIMIVDLMRNDLSKVCQDHTVIVPQLCQLETFAHVHHLVSVIQGQLKPQFNALDLLKACFPGGSITGSPKIRAMQIIAELEPHRRGPYCGSIAYLGFDGCLNSSITIRSYALKGERIAFHAGGGIVLDSSPEAEYQETLVKAAPFQRTLTSTEEL